MKYRNIIFDFDGTLADTAELTVETMHRTNLAMNLPDKSDAECKAMIGYRLEEIPSILWPDVHDLSERYAATFREIYKSAKEDFKVRTYPGVSDTLTRLKLNGIRMAVASSRSKVSLMELCSELHIADYFQMIVGGGDVKNGKPAPDPVNLVLATQEWDKDETLVVGDILAAGYWGARISEISQEDTVLIIGAGLPQKQGSIHPRGYMLPVYG